MAPLFRRLVDAAAIADLAGGFDITLEATHHGPWVETPCLFAEIGSSEAEWQRTDAAALWAAILANELRLCNGGGGEWWDLLREGSRPPDTLRSNTLPSSANTTRNQPKRDLSEPEASGSARAVVAVGLGGGHYAPRHGDLIRRSRASGPVSEAAGRGAPARSDSGGAGGAPGGVPGGLFLGHVAASYALDFSGNSWQSAVRECVESTRRAFPVSRLSG
jgi:D-aminoacyl-tRNA deacylase